MQTREQFQRLSAEFPTQPKQGIISAEKGFLTQEQGISLAKAKIFAG
jgi:hypothetical protein